MRRAITQSRASRTAPADDRSATPPVGGAAAAIRHRIAALDIDAQAPLRLADAASSEHRRDDAEDDAAAPGASVATGSASASAVPHVARAPSDDDDDGDVEADSAASSSTASAPVRPDRPVVFAPIGDQRRRLPALATASAEGPTAGKGAASAPSASSLGPAPAAPSAQSPRFSSLRGLPTSSSASLSIPHARRTPDPRLQLDRWRALNAHVPHEPAAPVAPSAGPIDDVARAGFEFEGVGEASLRYVNAPANPPLKKSELDLMPALYHGPHAATMSARNEQVKRLPLHRTPSFTAGLGAARDGGGPVTQGASLHVEIPTTLRAERLPLEAVTAAHPLTVAGMSASANSLKTLLTDPSKEDPQRVAVNAPHPLNPPDAPPLNVPQDVPVFDDRGGLSAGAMVPGSYGIESRRTLSRKPLPKSAQTTVGIPIRSLFDGSGAIDHLTEDNTEQRARLNQATEMATTLADAHHREGATDEQKHALRYLMLQSVMHQMAAAHKRSGKRGMEKNLFGLNLKGQTTGASVGLDDDHLFEMRERAAALQHPATPEAFGRVAAWEPHPDRPTDLEDKSIMIGALAQVGKPGLSAQAAYEGGADIPNFRNAAADGELSTVVEARQSGAPINVAAHRLHGLQHDKNTATEAEDFVERLHAATTPRRARSAFRKGPASAKQ